MQTLLRRPPVTSSRPDLATIWQRIDAIAGRPFRDLLEPDELSRLVADKGGSGSALERLVGVPASTRRLDLEDGELKSFRCDRDGDPLESVAVCQIGARVDEWLELPPFERTPVHAKLARVLLFGVCKESPTPAGWCVVLALEMDARPGRYWFAELERSYRDVMARWMRALSAEEPFRTITSDALQLRVRDSRPYTPVVSARLGREISNKNIGFYLTRAFVRRLVQEALSTGGTTFR